MANHRAALDRCSTAPKPPCLPSILMPSESSLGNIFGPKALADNFHNSTLRIWSDFFRMNENFIQQMLPCLLAWMAKVAWLSNQALKCYIHFLAR